MAMTAGRPRALWITVLAMAAATVLMAACAAQNTTGVGGRLEGMVRAGPTCPVETAGKPCPAAPVAGEVRLEYRGKVAARTRTDAVGRYVLDAPAGEYTLVVDVGGPFPRCPATPVTVRTTATLTVDVDCDTGIR